MSAQIRTLQVERVPLRVVNEPEVIPSSTEDRANALSFELFEDLLAYPENVPRIIPGALLALIPEHDPEVAELNLEAARRAVRQGQPVQYLFTDIGGRPRVGRTYDIEIDLRNETWGIGPRPELGDRTAEEMRQLLPRTVTEAQVQGPISLTYENVVVFNGVRVYMVDEPEPGVFRCITFEPQLPHGTESGSTERKLG
jgi:hypothetical protein